MIGAEQMETSVKRLEVHSEVCAGQALCPFSLAAGPIMGF